MADSGNNDPGAVGAFARDTSPVLVVMTDHHITSSLVALLAGFLAVPVHAAIFANYNAQQHERFTSGTTPNPTFLLSAYDLSGVAYDPTVGMFDARGSVLITPEHVLTAWHFQPSSVSFRGTDGSLHSYAVAEWHRLTTGPDGSDVAIGRLASEVPASDNVNALPIAIGPDGAFIGHELCAFGQNNQAGRNLIDEIVTVSTGTDPTVTTAYDYDSPVNGGTGGVGDDEIGLIGGDSGYTSLILANGELGVLGAHFAVSEAPGQMVITPASARWPAITFPRSRRSRLPTARRSRR